MAYKTVKPAELIEKFQFALNTHWGYIWGKAGELWTEKKQENLNKTTDPEREQSRKYGSQWIGHMVADCSGLFTWAFKELGGTMYHGSETMFNKWCVKTGPLNTAAKKTIKPGTAVFTKDITTGQHNHVGLFIGKGQVIEACSSRYGVVISSLTNRKWVEWGELKYVDYAVNEAPKPVATTTDIPVPANIEHRTLRFFCRGEDVKTLQEKLNTAGYACGSVDGIFGKKTLTAVKSFQGSRGLKVDGIVGPKTWEALDAIK